MWNWSPVSNLWQVKTIGRANKTKAVVAFAVIKPSYVELFSVANIQRWHEDKNIFANRWKSVFNPDPAVVFVTHTFTYA